MITLRRATEDDLEEIAALEEISFPSPWKRAYFAGELQANGRFCVVAVGDDERVVGYVFAMHYLDEMHINKIATHPEVRRGGIATVLMAACRGFAVSHGVRTMSLEVRESNLAAQTFYRKLHFHPVYTRRNYYPDGEAAVVMMAGVDAAGESG